MKRLMLIIGVLILHVCFFALVYFLGAYLVETYVTPPAGNTSEDYLDKLLILSGSGLVISTIFSLVWAGLALKYFKYTKSELLGAQYRFWWICLLVCCFMAFFATAYVLGRPNEGHWFIWGLLFFSSAFAYYVATVLFSPSGAKYIPPLAEKLRLWK